MNEICKVASFDVIVSLDEYLPQLALPYRIVLGVELVKAMKSISILRGGVCKEEIKEQR